MALSLLLPLLACSSPAPDVPILDELGWLASVRAQRPDLFQSDCWNTMTLKPKHRAALLEGADRYAGLVARTYTPEDRAADLAWIRTNQEAELRFCLAHPGASGCDRICSAPCDACVTEIPAAAPERLPSPPSGYALCAAVGYRVGDWPSTLYDTEGAVLSWKVFFEFFDDARPSPEAMERFTRRLGERGFRGDWKLTASSGDPDRTRFQYNNLIVHAWSPADAELAEALGLELFRGQLAGRGRGLDVGTPPNAQDPTDWHHFLCEGEPSALPEHALRFVGFGQRPSVEFAPLAPATLLPLSEYKAQPTAGALVLWHPDFDADAALQEKVAAALRDDLDAVRRSAPAALEGARIAVAPRTAPLSALPQRGRGMGVHRSEVWLTERGIDAARAGVVEVYNAQDYLRAREQTPSTLAQLLTLSIAVRAPEACADISARLGTRCP